VAGQKMGEKMTGKALMSVERGPEIPCEIAKTPESLGK
jgi:hypothetical protein